MFRAKFAVVLVVLLASPAFAKVSKGVSGKWTMLTEDKRPLVFDLKRSGQYKTTCGDVVVESGKMTTRKGRYTISSNKGRKDKGTYVVNSKGLTLKSEVIRTTHWTKYKPGTKKVAKKK